MSGSCREALKEVWQWSGGRPECPGVVGRLQGVKGVVLRHSQMSGSGRDALPDVHKSLYPPWRCLGVVREWSGGFRELREWF